MVDINGSARCMQDSFPGGLEGRATWNAELLDTEQGAAIVVWNQEGV